MTATDPRLILRAPVAEDVVPLTEATNMPGVRAGTLRLPYTSHALFRERLTSPSPGTHAVVACWDGHPAGYGALMLGQGRQRHQGELLLFVHDDFWGRGIGRALLAALIDLADNWYGLTRLGLEAAPGNTRALAMYEAAGFLREGLKRGDVISNGQLEDTVVMGRLRPPPALAP